jgi:type I restriction enzyme S subunit
VNWQDTKVGCLCKVGRGSSPRPKNDDRYFENGTIPWIKVADATASGKYLLETKEHVNAYGASFSRLLRPGSLIICTRGTLGLPIFLGVEGCIHDGWLYTYAYNGLDPEFFYYFLQTQRSYFSSVASGAAIQNINTDILRSTSIRVPSVDEQIRIASTLRRYDDLIENNRRRIALLEDAARQLYREWFVGFRFPGHEHSPTIAGIPGGWISATLDDLCNIGRGASPRPIADFMGGEVPWFKIKDATASESAFILDTEEKVTHDGARKSVFVEPGDLVLSNSATCGVPYFAGLRGCVHDGWLHFSDLQRVSKQFLYCYLYFKREELISSVGDGSTQKNLNTSAVGRLSVIIPEMDTLLRQFDDAVQPMYRLIFTLARQNRNLRAARDLLLPRLVRGEISVPS